MPIDYKQICLDNIRRRGEEFDDIGRLISEQLYSDRSHFVYELLQNAEDALERRFRLYPNDNYPCKVQFRLFQDRMEFRHFGAPFNEEDVRGISDVLKGTKREDCIQIGKFGIGFKSVYGFTASPEIHSGDEHFIIKRYIRPEAKDPNFISIANHETVFNFPFDHKELSDKNAFNLILKKLRELGPRILLFLRRIDEIEWSVEPEGEKGQYLLDSKKVKNCENVRRVNVIGQNNGKDEEENWLVFNRQVPVADSDKQVSVEIAFRLQFSTKDKTESIVKIKNSPLIVYFPTEKVTNFGFLTQGPYRTTPSRDNILKGDDWNDTLVKETAYLLTDALPKLKALGLLSVSLLEALPIRMDDFEKDSMFYPIVVEVRKVLLSEDLLPADDGTFVSARNAKLARGVDLRKLLNQDQLRSLFQSTNSVKWLTGEITQDLRAYLMIELKVEEVTADSFARKITQSFLSSHSDDWFIQFFGYLSGQEALWRPPRWNGDTEWGLLRAKPILRLQDDSLKAPFRSDGTTPNAFIPPQDETDFPIVKRSIVSEWKAKDFLKRLGLSEPDIFDDIVRLVLPKYKRPEASSISPNEHTVNIQKILRALCSDSEIGKKKVIQATSHTPFLKAVDQNGATEFKKPVDIYYPTQELKDYFLGTPNVWFLNEFEAEKEWYSIGIENKPRFNKIMVDLPYDERSRLRGNQGCTRNIETIDYELDGINNFLLKLSEKEKTFGKYSLILWNFLLRHFKESPPYPFYEGVYKWFYRQERAALFDPIWKKQLRSNAWLPKNGDDVPHLPSELRVVDLPDSFDCDDKLTDLLGMRKDVIATLAEKAGIQAEDIEFITQHPEEFRRLKDSFTARNDKTIFPTRTVEIPERRQERLAEQLTNAPEKEYVDLERRVRITRGTVDPALWLRNQYKNDTGQMVCQICKEEMPFKKRDGEYYFEAVEALSNDYFSKEHEAQYLALCPLCAARYKEFVKHDDNAMKALSHALKDSEKPEVSQLLGEFKTSIQFVESHWQDIKTILTENG